MTGALVVVAALLGLVVLVLAVPVSIVFRFDGLEGLNGRISIGWLFGLVRFGFDVPDADKREATAPATRRARRRRAKSGWRGGGSRAWAVLRRAPFRRRVVRLVKDLVAAAHPRNLRLRVRLGLGDPADTGRLWAIVGPLGAMARNLRDAEVHLEPEFVEPVLEFDAQGRLLLVPLQFIALAVAFVFSPASLRAWWTLGAGRG